jgi:hypothetical protein
MPDQLDLLIIHQGKFEIRPLVLYVSTSTSTSEASESASSMRQIGRWDVEEEKGHVPNLTKALAPTPCASLIMNFKSGCADLIDGYED